MSSPPDGLSSAEAAVRRARFGANTLPDPDRRGPLRILASLAREPMFLLLVAAAGIYLTMDARAEGLMLAAFALMSVGLVAFQEHRAERALEALRALACPQARAVRDGQIIRLSAADLVPGDVVALEEGDRVPADVRLLGETVLACDESLLTGESAPVEKRAGAAGEAAMAFGGALIARGGGWGEVVATGRSTRAGQIGAALAAIESGPTPLQKSMTGLIRTFAVLAVLVSLAVVGWLGWTRGDWLEATLLGIATAMSLLPEEFPMALAVIVALGAHRLSRLQVLTRSPAAVETLGAATVLCVDKTGTLTQNKMRLSLVVTADGARHTPALGADAGVDDLLLTAAKASRADGVDPMDHAVRACAQVGVMDGLRHVPVSIDRPFSTSVWRGLDGLERSAVKGAPEALFAAADGDSAVLSAAADALAREGYRVLAVGERASSDAGPLRLLGLLAFEDPLRPAAPAAIAQARAAGVRVVMLTGDHAETARAVAKACGLNAGRVVTGPDLDAATDAQFQAAITGADVFARIRPDHKLRLVRALQAGGACVAMTGDGVNDAPALKAADIGVAMGQRGADVAREAADIVLLDDAFERIVDGVAMGRRIYANLRKVGAYIVAVHAPLAGLALAPALFGIPPILTPAHVALTEMVIDPMCAIAFEAEAADPNAMRRPPRARKEPLLNVGAVLRAAGLGGLVFVAALVAYLIWAPAGGEEQARALAFMALSAGNLALVSAHLSARPAAAALFAPGRAAFWTIVVLTTAIAGAVLFWPPLSGPLDFSAPPAAAAAAAMIAASLPVLAVDALLKRFNARGASGPRYDAAKRA